MSDAMLRYLLSPIAIRERAARVLELALSGGTHFSVHLEKLPEVSKLVVDTTRANYPDLAIPFHSRWGHFKVGGVDRLKQLDERLGGLDADSRARSKLDLAVTSVLLDAGSGPGWKYGEQASGRDFDRSEGLAVASFHLFLSGAFSSDARKPFQADARGLQALDRETLCQGFQVSASNPLVGVDGRLHLLRQLGAALESDPERFKTPSGELRPGGILDLARKRAKGGRLEAASLLYEILRGFGPIWPGRAKLDGVPLGDVWPHSALGDVTRPESFVPFHKLSQWLTYSLIEPLEDAGVRITDVDGMTGLAEYRNGGLLIDSGLIRLRDPAQAGQAHLPSSELVIEWRALTVALLDRIATEVRAALGFDAERFPLAKVLEGGTWWAGRKLAAQARAGGGPPLRIQSDGTVF
jgi:hypothetical protein